jgi:hypothetical protein
MEFDMKNEEDEAFDELAKRQGAWGGGFSAKRAMAAGKLQEPEREALQMCLEYIETNAHERKHVRHAIQAALAQPAQQEAIYGMNQDDWKDVVAAITKVRDGRGIYLGCRPADVFKDWFLALGTAKVKEKNNG